MRWYMGLLVGCLLSALLTAGCGGNSGDSGTAGTVGATGGTTSAPVMMPPEAGGMNAPMGGMPGDMGGMMGTPGGMGMTGAAPAAPTVDPEVIAAQRKAEAAESKAEGDRLLRLGDYDSAIAEYELASVDDPDNAEIRRSIARAKSLKDAAKRRNVDKLVRQGRSLFYQGEYLRAASVLEQAVQQDPLHSEAIGYLVASGAALKNLQDHGWPQTGLVNAGGQFGGQGGGMGMSDMGGGATPGMGGGSGSMPGMGGPGMPGGGAMPGMGGGGGRMGRMGG